MSQASYQVQIDTRRNNTFAGTYDDITDYVMNVQWSNGMGAAYQDTAPMSPATFVLDNDSGVFSQDPLGSELLTNGGFNAWTADDPDGWTVTGESGTDPQVSQVGASKTHGGGGTGECNIYTSASALSISQNVLTSGTRYKVTLMIDTLAGTGGVVVKNNGAAVSPVYHAMGLKTFYFTAGAADFTLAADGAANVTIDNVSCKAVRRYGGAITRGTLIRFRATWNSTTYQLFIGKIKDIEFTPGVYGKATCTLTTDDPMATLDDFEYQPSLITNATIDQGLSEIFDKATLDWPMAGNFWLLGVEGSSELGTTTALYNNNFTTFATGKSTLAWLGSNADTTGNGVNVRAYITDLMMAEAGGRFWFDARQGKFVMTNRHHDVNNTSAVATYTADDYDDAPPLAYGDICWNDVTVNYQPRKVGQPNSEIYKAGDVIEIQPGQIKTMTCRYTDVPGGSNARVSATDVRTPERYRDFTVEIRITQTSTDSGGTTITSEKIPTLVTLPVDEKKFSTVSEGNGGHLNSDHTKLFYCELTPGATSAKLVIHRLNKGHRVNYMSGLRILGTPLLTYDKRAAHSQDGDSIRANGKHSKTFTLPQVEDESFAQEYADFIISRFKDPFTRLREVTIYANKTDSRMTAVMTRAIGDRITVSDTANSHTLDYVIVGERHTVKAGGAIDHKVTWVLEPANPNTYWALGVAGFGELGTATRLML